MEDINKRTRSLFGLAGMPFILVAQLVDKYSCRVSVSRVSHIPKRAGLIKRIDVKVFVTGKEYRRE